MIKHIKSSSFLMYSIIIALSTSPAFALGVGNRNLFLIGVMAISPLLIMIYKEFYKSDIWLVLFLISIVLSPLGNHPESMRWSTVMYTFMFGLIFLAYHQLLHVSRFTIENYQNLLKYLIYAYSIVLLIQQFCVLTGLPIFNLSNYDPMEPWKLNSLTSEPSHSARIVALLMFSYITTQELILKRKYNFDLDFKVDKWVWFGFLWTMVTMGSGTAFAFIAIVLLKFVKLKNLIALFIIFGLMIFLANIFGITAFERTFKVFIATLTFDTEVIIEADHSAAFRIVPLLLLAQRVGVTTLDDWFGHGIDYVGSFLSSIMLGLPEGYTGGGLFQLWMDYGFLSFILFIIFSFSHSFRKGDYISMAFWFMLVFIYNINNQIVWITIVLLFTNQYYNKQLSKSTKRFLNK